MRTSGTITRCICAAGLALRRDRRAFGVPVEGLAAGDEQRRTEGKC